MLGMFKCLWSASPLPSPYPLKFRRSPWSLKSFLCLLYRILPSTNSKWLSATNNIWHSMVISTMIIESLNLDPYRSSSFLNGFVGLTYESLLRMCKHSATSYIRLLLAVWNHPQSRQSNSRWAARRVCIILWVILQGVMAPHSTSKCRIADWQLEWTKLFQKTQQTSSWPLICSLSLWRLGLSEADFVSLVRGQEGGYGLLLKFWLLRLCLPIHFTWGLLLVEAVKCRLKMFLEDHMKCHCLNRSMQEVKYMTVLVL